MKMVCCPECYGEGTTEYPRGYSSDPYRLDTCEVCDGTGFVPACPNDGKATWRIAGPMRFRCMECGLEIEGPYYARRLNRK